MSHKAWEFFAKDISQSSLENLHKNQSFNQTMFCSAYEKEELKYLEQFLSLDEIERLVWEPIETMTEGNNIHQLYHLMKYIEFAGEEIFQENILEFGAGYGSLCTRINRLLKPQRYNIIDLPELQRVQAQYLAENEITNVNWYDSFGEYLKFKDCSGIFVALWSISETPQEIRDYFAENANFNYYFFAYGDDFFDMKNLDYFDKFREDRPHLKWYREKIPFMSNQYYLMAKNNE